MRKIFTALAMAALLPLFPVPAYASAVEAPTWAADTGLPAGFTWGNWFPCRVDYQITDCIESVKWLKSDGTSVDGVWLPRPNFNFSTFKQSWVQESNGESAQYFKTDIYEAGSYSFEGMANPCGNNQIVFDARATHYGFQINAKPTCGGFFKSKFEERFEVVVRSKYLKGFAGAISSNGKSPELQYTESNLDQLLTIKANFAYIAWNIGDRPGTSFDICKKNEYRAGDGGWSLWNTIIWVKMTGDSWLATHPGDMITGTNGWNCGGVMYWDSQQEALVMQVGSPHYDPDGNVVEGWFEGAIRGRYITARFGIQSNIAAGTARLEIIYDNGERKIATITAKYDSASDWLYLRGYGFTYSNPQLLVKFDKPKEEIAAPIATPSPVAIAAAPLKKTITCIKGKVSKKITAVKPLCPQGYKKR